MRHRFFEHWDRQPAVWALVLLAGCSGGASHMTAPAPPVRATPSASAQVSARFTIPAKVTTASSKRAPRYVSASSQGLALFVYATGSARPASPTVLFDISAQSSLCTSNADGSRLCSFSVPAPTGNDDFEVDLYDAVPTNGQVRGNLLGTGKIANQAIVEGALNSLNVAVGGVVASLSVQPASMTAVADGQTHQFSVVVNMLDAGRNYIVGSDPLVNPVTLSVSGDANTTMHLATSTITSPNSNTVQLTYNGGALQTGTITAQAGTISATASLQPMNVSPSTIAATTSSAFTVQVSDAGYTGGTYQARSSDPTCATVSPSAGQELPAGAVVTFTVTPVANGSCTVTISGREDVRIPVSVSLPAGSANVPALQHWLVAPRSEPISVTESGYTGAFTASVNGSCATVSPASANAVNGAATFTVSGASEGTCTVTVTGAKAHTFAYSIKSDTWTNFAGNLTRNGQGTPNSGITKSTVGKLGLRWINYLGHEVVSSPLVANGRVFVATNDGIVAAYDAKSGSTVWQTQPFGSSAQITMTPALDAAQNLLFVGRHSPGGASVPFAALNADTGAIVWSVSLPGPIRSEPAIINGAVYVGTAGGDTPGCLQGGVSALNESTGQLLWKYNVDPVPNDGGSVWAPISYDGTNLIFGTGNTCVTSISSANSVVAVSPATGQQVWAANIQEPSTDDNDVGGGVMVLGNLLYVTSKNGNLYTLDHATGLVQTTTPVGYDPIGTPSNDGTTVIVSGGWNSTASSFVGGLIRGFDLSGNQKWKVVIGEHPVQGVIPITNGVAFTTLDGQLVALDAETGSTLWSYNYDPGNYAYASPAIAESGVYAVSIFGELTAFGIGDTASPSAIKRLPLKRQLTTGRAPRMDEHGHLH